MTDNNTGRSAENAGESTLIARLRQHASIGREAGNGGEARGADDLMIEAADALEAARNAGRSAEVGDADVDQVTLGLARFVLRDLHQKHPKCGYLKMSEAVWRAQYAILSQAPRVAGEDGWRPIETAPKDGTAILLARAGGDLSGLDRIWRWERSDERWVAPGLWSWTEGAEHSPTHWHPRPAPPASAERAVTSDVGGDDV